MPTLALAGDTMLGRGAAQRLQRDREAPLLAPEVVAQIQRADAFLLNLECCISERGAPFPDPRKPFFFRAPPIAAERLKGLGVTAVTLANNHALDFGVAALLDTLRYLAAAGIQVVGAGDDEAAARAPLHLLCNGLRVRLVAFCDHPRAYAASVERPGVAYADLSPGLPGWVVEAVSPREDADLVLVTPHWGPNMVAQPTPPVRRAAEELRAAGATVIAGHSAHVFQSVAPGVLFDLGDFFDDYAVDQELRNDLGLLWLLELDTTGLRALRALPLALDYCFTRAAVGEERRWVTRRLQELCAPLGTRVVEAGALLDILT